MHHRLYQHQTPRHRTLADMATLEKWISGNEEEEFQLETNDFLRPSLKQINNSVFKIKKHFTAGGLRIIPSEFTSPLKEIKDDFLRCLEKCRFFASSNLITDETFSNPFKEGLVLLSETLTSALDIPVTKKPDNVKCDAFVALSHQAVMVLTFTEEIRESQDTRMYNTCLARGVTTVLRRFTNDSVNVIFGVLVLNDLKDENLFLNKVKLLAKRSSLTVTQKSLSMNQVKYDNILHAFWAGVSEIKCFSRETENQYISFLTKEQCIAMVENINNSMVNVSCKPGSGATTLMLELARRMSRTGDTLLLTWSRNMRDTICGWRWSQGQEERHFENRLLTDLNGSDMSTYINVVDESGAVPGTVRGKFWKFTKDCTGCDELRHGVAVLEKEMISRDEEEEFVLETNDYLRPPLKQINNSVFDIKRHFTTDGLKIIPSEFASPLKEIKDDFLGCLEKCRFFASNNLVSDETLPKPFNQGLVLLSETLTLALDIPVTKRPDTIKCDALLALSHQAVMVLTFTEEIRESQDTRMYNTCLARGVTTVLHRFTNDSVNVIFGVLVSNDLRDENLFLNKVKLLAKRSSLTVTQKSLSMNQVKYDNILHAFWAGVSEIKCFSRETENQYISFLTKEQCIAMVENINNSMVNVSCKPGSGATTLMRELARRMSRTGDTLLLTWSRNMRDTISGWRWSQGQEERLFDNKSLTDLNRSDISAFTNVIVESGIEAEPANSKIWTFTKDPPVLDDLKKDVMALEKIENKMKNLICFLSSDEVQGKVLNVSKASETLKLLDVIIQSLSLIKALSGRLTLEFTPVHHYPPGSGDRNKRPETGVSNKRLETEDYLNHVLCQTIRGIKTRGDLFLLLCDMITQIRNPVIDLRLKTDTQSNDSETIMDESESRMADRQKDDVIKLIDAKVDWQHIVYNLPEGMFEIRVPDFSPTKEQDKPRPQNEAGTGETDLEHQTTSETSTGKSLLESCHAKVTDSEDIKELQETLKTMEKEVSRQKDEMSDLSAAADRLVEWEDTMDWMAQQMSTLKIKDIIADVIEGEGIPLSFDSPVKQPALEADHRSTRKRSLVYQMREMQYGTVKTGELMDIARDVTTDDLTRLTYTLFHFDSLGHGPAMTLHRDRVHRRLDVSEDGQELVNWRESGHHSDQFQKYRGTCSRLPIPLPPSPSTLTAPTYWETDTRVQVKSEVSAWPLLQMGVSEEGQVDTEIWVGRQSRGWSVHVTRCGKHPGYCTQVWSERRQCGVCLTDTLTHTPGTDVSLKYGAVVDIGRGRLAFIDLNRGRVLHRFNVKIRESIRPMFGVWPLLDECDVTMRLVSGVEITMDDRKQNLIAKALFGQ